LSFIRSFFIFFTILLKATLIGLEPSYTIIVIEEGVSWLTWLTNLGTFLFLSYPS
jgi:hypothetical protein